MKSLFSSQIGLVGTVMNMQLDRQNIIAGNLANIDTPNYKPRELSFEKELQTALGQDMEGQMSRRGVEAHPSDLAPSVADRDCDRGVCGWNRGEYGGIQSASKLASPDRTVERRTPSAGGGDQRVSASTPVEFLSRSMAVRRDG